MATDYWHPDGERGGGGGEFYRISLAPLPFFYKILLSSLLFFALNWKKILDNNNNVWNGTSGGLFCWLIFGYWTDWNSIL